MLRGTSMLTTCCVAVCILLHCWLMIMNVVAGTYCVPGTTCSSASTAPCTQTASGSGTCSCSASLVPESTVCVPWGRCTLLHPHCGTLRTLKHSICVKLQKLCCRKTCLWWRVLSAWHRRTDLTACIFVRQLFSRLKHSLKYTV